MSQANSPKRLLSTLLVAFGAMLYAGGMMHGRFLGHGWPFSALNQVPKVTDVPHSHDAHAGHDHGTHSNENSVELSETARKNLGLTDEFLVPIELASFDRTISVPAVVVDQPGRTRLPVSAATTGIVTHVHAVTGEALMPGDLIIEMRLTHEDLVTSQKEFLQALGDRDVEIKEIARLESVASSGGISNKTLLERQYNRDKIDSLLKSQREALRLHGLSEAQIGTIESTRRLLTELSIRVPDPDSHSPNELQFSQQRQLPLSKRSQKDMENSGNASDRTNFRTVSATEQDATGEHLHQAAEPTTNRLLVLQDLRVQKGQVVSAGELLCTMADFGNLLIEGQAFESEASLVAKAKLERWKVFALVDEGGSQTKLKDLELAWVDNEINPMTRALRFYVELPNVVLQESRNAGQQRHITWRFRTGQRMQLLVPVERWTEQIVLPTDAVVREGIDSFVFQQNGDRYERIPVHERYRDQTSVVIENDGTLYPGDIVAIRGAHQLQMALKNKAGGAVDPHAGHHH